MSERGRNGEVSVEPTRELAAALRAGDGGSSRSRVIAHTHTQPLSRQDSPVAGLTPHTPAPVGWSASERDIAAPLLVSQGGIRTTDVDGATWVVEP